MVTTLSGSISSLLLQPDGKIVAAGSASVGSRLVFAVLRFTSNGSPDTNFGTGGQVTTAIGTTNDFANSLALQADGKLLVAGSTMNISHIPAFALVRYTSSGGLDSSFGTGGKVVTSVGNNGSDSAASILVQPDGKILTSGHGENDNTENFVSMRFNSSGVPDTSFGNSGKVITLIGSAHNRVDTSVLQPDGKLVVGGFSYNSNQDFALVRYTSTGILDTLVDLPLMTEIKPNHALAGQTITLDIQGWNLDDVIGVQLRNSSTSVNGSGLNVTSTRITAQFTLPVSLGLYDLYLAKNLVNKSFIGVFSVLAPLSQPVQWQIADLDKAGNPIDGPAGIAIGETDGSGLQTIFVANSDTRLYAYKKTSTWAITPLPLQASYFQDVILADANQDGIYEVYGANSYPNIFQFQWNGSDWCGKSFCAYSNGPLASGSLIKGIVGIYSLAGRSLTQSCWSNSAWISNTINAGDGSLLCSIVGDANNDQVNEVYAASDDNQIYQFE